MSMVAYPELIADAYRMASLAGAPMLVAAPVLESVRDKMKRLAEPGAAELASSDALRGFPALELLERQIAAADDGGLAEALVALRTALQGAILLDDRARVRAAFTRGAAAGWKTWRHAFGTALGHFRMRHCRALAEELARLAEEPGEAAGPPEDVAAMVAASPALVEEDWASTLDVFTRVGACEDVGVMHRCKALLSAAQVQIFHLKDLELAQRHIDAAQALCPDGRVASVQGELHVQQGRREEGRKSYEEAVRLSPELADGYLAIAELLLNDPGTPDLDSAEQWSRHALQCVGGLRAYGVLIEILVKRTGTADHERRIDELLTRAVRAEPDSRPTLLLQVGRSYANVRNYDKALPYFDELLSTRQPQRPNHLVWRGMLRNALARHNEARLDLFEALSTSGPSVDEARAELERMAQALAKEERALAPGKAMLDEISRVLGEKYEPTYRAKLQDLREQVSLAINSDANKEFSAGRYPAAIELYQRAIALHPDPVYSSNLAGAWQYNEDVPVAMALDHAAVAMRAALARAPDDAEYRTELERMERERTLVERFPIPLARRPVVTPIAVEVAADVATLLVDGASGELGAAPAQLFAGMRDEIFRQVGARVPGVRVRSNPTDLPDGTYVIMMCEVPVVSGNLVVERLWAISSPDHLATLGVEATVVIHPGTGAETSWITAACRERVVAAGIAVLSPIDYLVRHLRSVVERSLPDLVGVQEVNALLAEAKLLPDVEPHAGALPAFTAVLRALVAEGVPIVELRLLWEGFFERWQGGSGRVEIVEGLRKLSAVRDKLPGNGEGETRFGLSEEFSAMLRKSILRDRSIPVLAMEPRVCQDALTAVRNALAGVASATLVCPSSVRPFLRKLVELEFPNVPVVCVAELSVPLSDSTPRISMSGAS